MPEGFAAAAVVDEDEAANPKPFVPSLQQSSLPSLEQQKSPSLTAAPLHSTMNWALPWDFISFVSPRPWDQGDVPDWQKRGQMAAL